MPASFNRALLLCFPVLLVLGYSPLVLAQSEGSKSGLSRAHDPLSLSSSVALVADADTMELLYAKNPHVSLPIASITKLMTAMVVLDAGQSLDEPITITEDDYDQIKHTRSRLNAGDVFTRRQLMQLALMSSENRAAAALGRNFPGGMPAIVERMNLKAQRLGMLHSHFAETTGLSSDNRSTANDLALLVIHAARYSLIERFSTETDLQIQPGDQPMLFKNTNKLVNSADWQIALQKTGFINEAGRCLVMKAKVGTRNLVIVLLDSVDRSSRFKDAERVKSYFSSVLALGR